MSEWDIVVRVVVAALLGGLVGFDREARDKPAGIRTHAMVAAGAALFVGASVLVSLDLESGGSQSARIDASRVTAGVVTGIGFLGAGSIIRRDGSVSGLTTAAGIWTVAAVGVAIAYGYWWVGLGGTTVVLLIQAADFLAHRTGFGVDATPTDDDPDP
ncbi:MAG: MgtC/SapB family protein [Ilumatobacteraceae bacterium]